MEKGSKKNTRKKLNEEIKTTDLYDNKWQLEVYDKGRPQKTEIIWEELTKNKNKYPGLVLAVVGDCDSYVPKPWNTTAFTTGLVNTVNGVESKIASLLLILLHYDKISLCHLLYNSRNFTF